MLRCAVMNNSSDMAEWLLKITSTPAKVSEAESNWLIYLSLSQLRGQ